MTGIVMQARLGSTRLYRKALLPLGQGCLVGSALKRLARVDADVRVLAVDTASYAELEPVARLYGYEIMAGPQDDVLARYCMVIREYKLDRVVRATGDNPFVSPELAQALVSWHDSLDEAERPHYAAHTGMPLGMGVELVDAPALLEAEAESSDPYEREHVCPFIYRRPERYGTVRIEAPVQYAFGAGRVTVDTQEDYRVVLEIGKALGDDPPSAAIVAWLKAGNAS